MGIAYLLLAENDVSSLDEGLSVRAAKGQMNIWDIEVH